MKRDASFPRRPVSEAGWYQRCGDASLRLFHGAWMRDYLGLRTHQRASSRGNPRLLVPNGKRDEGTGCGVLMAPGATPQGS